MKNSYIACVLLLALLVDKTIGGAPEGCPMISGMPQDQGSYTYINYVPNSGSGGLIKFRSECCGYNSNNRKLRITIAASSSSENCVVEIDRNSFVNFDRINSITIEKSCKVTIDKSAFVNCDNLQSVEFKGPIKFDDSGAFQKCNDLTTLGLPDSIEADYSGGVNCFRAPCYECKQLTTITVDRNNPDFFVRGGVVFDSTGKSLVLYPNGRNEDYEIPEGVEYLSTDAFAYSRVRSVTIPRSVKAFIIYDEYTNPFRHCDSLQSIDVVSTNAMNLYASDGILYKNRYADPILLAYPGGKGEEHCNVPIGISYIYPGAFDGVTGLKSLSLPGTITDFDVQTFVDCSNLEEVTYLGDADLSDYVNIFWRCPKVESICVTSDYDYSTCLGYPAVQNCNESSGSSHQSGGDSSTDSSYGSYSYGSYSYGSSSYPYPIGTVKNADFGCNMFVRVFHEDGTSHRVEILHGGDSFFYKEVDEDDYYLFYIRCDMKRDDMCFYLEEKEKGECYSDFSPVEKLVDFPFFGSWDYYDEEEVRCPGSDYAHCMKYHGRWGQFIIINSSGFVIQDDLGNRWEYTPDRVDPADFEGKDCEGRELDAPKNPCSASSGSVSSGSVAGISAFVLVALVTILF